MAADSCFEWQLDAQVMLSLWLIVFLQGNIFSHYDLVIWNHSRHEYNAGLVQVRCENCFHQHTQCFPGMQEFVLI